MKYTNQQKLILIICKKNITSYSLLKDIKRSFKMKQVSSLIALLKNKSIIDRRSQQIQLSRRSPPQYFMNLSNPGNSITSVTVIHNLMNPSNHNDSRKINIICFLVNKIQTKIMFYLINEIALKT